LLRISGKILTESKPYTTVFFKLGLSKLPDLFCEHPATVFVINNLHYSEAPWVMPGNVNLAAALYWREVRLEGASAH